MCRTMFSEMMPWHLETKVLKLYYFEVIAANPTITDVTASQMFPHEVWSAVFVARVIWASSLRVYRQDMCPFRSYGFLFSPTKFFPTVLAHKPLFISFIWCGSFMFRRGIFFYECWKMNIIPLYFPKEFYLTVLRFVAFNLWTPTWVT